MCTVNNVTQMFCEKFDSQFSRSHFLAEIDSVLFYNGEGHFLSSLGFTAALCHHLRMRGSGWRMPQYLLPSTSSTSVRFDIIKWGTSDRFYPKVVPSQANLNPSESHPKLDCHFQYQLATKTTLNGSEWLKICLVKDWKLKHITLTFSPKCFAVIKHLIYPKSSFSSKWTKHKTLTVLL